MRAKWPAVLFIVAVAIGLPGRGLTQEEGKEERLQRFLEEIDFSKKDFKRLHDGKVVTELIKSELDYEITVFSVVRIDVPRDFFIAHYFKDIEPIEAMGVSAAGQVSEPPVLEDFTDIRLDPRDLKALRNCKPGDCNVKMPARAMTRFRTEVDWDAEDHDAQAHALVHEMLLGYTQAYIKGGNTALAEYHDQKKPLRLEDEFADLLKDAPRLFELTSEYKDYLQRYPEGNPVGVRNAIYWTVEDIGASYDVLSLTHTFIIVPDNQALPPLLAAKRIYANHYFEAALGLTVLVPNHESESSSFYLAYLNRSRLDVLRRGGMIARVVRKKLKGALAKQLTKQMKTVRERTLALYAESAAAE